jgi:hypothetical protein
MMFCNRLAIPSAHRSENHATLTNISVGCR